MTRDTLMETLERISRQEFSRSGGPGGQNVNKVNTKVTLRVPVELLELTADDIERVREKLATRINDAGELVIQVSDTRSQRKNREIAVGRAADLLLQALVRPGKRRPTRPSAAAKERRLQAKSRRARTKRDRRVDEE
jgi:ribosome-associated protein